MDNVGKMVDSFIMLQKTVHFLSPEKWAIIKIKPQPGLRIILWEMWITILKAGQLQQNQWFPLP